MDNSPESIDSVALSNRLITIGCLLLLCPCAFLSAALVFYVGPIVLYGIRNGF